MAGFPPLTVQGHLNRVITHVAFPQFPNLSVTASFMSKNQCDLTFEPPFVDQIETATGIINSPRPFVMASLSINLLRSQNIAANYYSQIQVQANVGTVQVYSDSPTLPPITLLNCSITDGPPGPFDGLNPEVKITLKGVYVVNALLWTGSASTQ